MGDLDWIEPADWRHHSSDLVDVRVHDDGRPIVVMELVPPDRAALGAGWDRLRELWLDLPVHPNVLDAVDLCGDDGILLRYAAIDWWRKPARLREGALQAMHLRREIDRWARRALDDAGHQFPPTCDLPEDE